tara:strand:- start:48 stop:524 length:477 start_codon:yes stop_codon:yes gene_type:complete
MGLNFNNICNMKKIFILFFSFLLFNSCNKEDRMDEVNELTGNSLTSGLLKLQVNSECVPFQVQYEKTSSSNEIQELINTSAWETSWIANQGDRIYFKVKDPTSGGQGGAGYPGGITKLVDMKIIYKGEIIASMQQYFTHTNDGCYIYSTTVPQLINSN